MTYNALIDLAVFGLFLITLGATVMVLDKRNLRGATPANKRQIKAHQHHRRSHMLANGGLPVEMRCSPCKR